jgi:hypothetical protein
MLISEDYFFLSTCANKNFKTFVAGIKFLVQFAKPKIQITGFNFFMQTLIKKPKAKNTRVP